VKLLVVDVGNTSTAVGLWTNGRVSNVRHIDGKLEGLEGLVPLEGLDVLGERGRREEREGREGSGHSPASKFDHSIVRLFDYSLDGLAYVSVVPSRDAKWRKSAKKFGLKFHQLSYQDLPLVSNVSSPRVPCDSRVPRVSTPSTKNASATTSVHCSLSTVHCPLPPPLSLDYPKPETIGADRLADAAGAVSRYGAPVLVMDFGTALTAAIVTDDGVWRGGVIAPGFPLMRDYLFERTAKLPRMELGRGQAPKIGRSTEEAMRFGALVGYRGMVREIATTLRKNFKQDFKLVATGGFARWALRGLDLPFVIDPTLTLYGAGLLCARHF
jgi:pantothenate kinase type III